MRYALQSICLLLVWCCPALAQDSTLLQIPVKYLDQVRHKTSRLDQQITQRTEKLLERFAKEEQQIQTKLSKLDSVAAAQLFDRYRDTLQQMQAQLKNRISAPLSKVSLLTGGYNGYLDTLQSSLAFLKEAKAFSEKASDLQNKLSSSLRQVQELQSKLQYTEQIKAYIRQRKQQLRERLSAYTGFTKNVDKLNKATYYYTQQLSEYKQLLKDKKKAEIKAMELLKKVPAYNKFIQQHSQLAGLFNVSGDNGTPDLQGLQTRSQIETLIQQRIASGGPNARAVITQQMEAAKAQFNDLKNKFPTLDNTADMPAFKPNDMKTKSFKQRLEFGGNVQFQRSSAYFPTTSDVTAQVAYKFHKNGSVGLGAAYKLGLGTGLDNIRLSHQGIGIRSFLDWKLKGSFYLNGGFEQNYNSGFERIEQLKNWNGWKGSALIGISKKYKISEKFKGSMVLLYDFLHNLQEPKTGPVKLRLGYSL